MKRILMTILLIGVFSFLSSNTQFSTVGDKLLVEFNNTERSDEDILQTIAFPAEEVTLTVKQSTVEVYNKNGEFLRSEISADTEVAEIVSSFVQRDLIGHNIKIKTKSISGENVKVLKNVQYEISPGSQKIVVNEVSTAFAPVYKSVVDNYETSYLRDADVVPSNMLIVTPQGVLDALDMLSLTQLEDFINWKIAKGISVNLVTVEEAGGTNNSIKNYIQDAYDNNEERPDYVVLMGDAEDNSFIVPSFYFFESNNVSDLPFSLMAGDDYMPDLLVGRFSMSTIFELAVMLHKTIYYEKNPFIDDDDWFESAVIVAADSCGGPPNPTTPVAVSRWLAAEMEDYGYHTITEIYYPEVYPGTQLIAEAINNGAGFVSYRGWGDANGWHFPYFHTENIDQLTNGPQMPVMTSIVCNTGDFANNVDPCFGEKWMRVGSPTTPKGGVAFVGPSDLHTNTKYNNAIFAGFYNGVLHEDVYGFGAAVLLGKHSLYNNFPNLQGTGENVEFNFYVYNILSDPSLDMWTTVPAEIDVTLPGSVNVGTNHLDLALPGLNGAVITAVKSGEFVFTELVENESVTLYFDSQTPGDIEVTITKPNRYPLVETISVNAATTDVGILSVNTQAAMVSGASITGEMTLKNYGSETANSVSGTINCDNADINITDGSVSFGSIGAGSTAADDFTFDISADCPNNTAVEFELTTSTREVLKFELVVSSLAFDITETMIDDDNNLLELGEERPWQVTLKNISTISAVNLNAELVSLSDAVTVTNSSSNIGDLNPGQTGIATFTIEALDDGIPGKRAWFELNLVDQNGLYSTETLVIEIGPLDSNVPTGRDSYGYFAYDSFDVDWAEPAPVYFWTEIDPNYGGSGDVFSMVDDQSETVDLPFDFMYYGENYSSITMCSNGWISFIPTEEKNFRNWTIPMPLGPYAMVAAFWDDLKGEAFQQGEDILYHNMRICYYHDTANHQYIIEWNECRNRAVNEVVEKFQIVLYDPSFMAADDGNGVIQVNYNEISNVDATNNYATIGIENATQSDGLLYSYADIYPTSATPIQNEFAIKYTTNPPGNHNSSGNENVVPIVSELKGNYPNPFNPTTTFKFSLTENAENAEIIIYNVKGQEVKQIPLNSVELANKEVVWNGDDAAGNAVSSSIYFYKLNANGKKIDMKKCVLLK
jgi:hypothetical protein